MESTVSDKVQTEVQGSSRMKCVTHYFYAKDVKEAVKELKEKRVRIESEGDALKSYFDSEGDYIKWDDVKAVFGEELCGGEGE